MKERVLGFLLSDKNSTLSISMLAFYFYLLLLLEPPEIGPFSFSKDVMNEGDFAQISCIVTSGDQPLTISWSFHGDGTESDSPDNGITTTNLGTRMSMLVIEQVKHTHQGYYTCQAKNNAGVSSYSTRLKVNGKYFYPS